MSLTSRTGALGRMLALSVIVGLHVGLTPSFIGVSRAEDGQPPDGPRVFFIDVEAGPVSGGLSNFGVPISIFGKGFGNERGASRVTIGGVEVATYLVWGSGNAHNKMLDMIVVQPGAKVKPGAIVVTVNGVPSNSDCSFKSNSGKVYFVAVSGSDSSPCSASAPCATILHTFSVMKPGDTTLVRGGSYAEGEIWIRSPDGGAADAPKVIKNYPGEEVYLPNSARGFIVDANYVTVSGLQFQNGKSMVAAGWANRDQRANRFINNTFAGKIDYAAIEITGPDHLLAGNVCDVATSTQGTEGHCYYVTQGSNLKVLYNIASGAPGYGLHIFDERRASGDFQRVIRDVLVEGNILKNSTQRSGMIIEVADQGGYGNHIEDITIRNNVFAANDLVGLVVMGISKGVKVYNNTFYQNGREALYVDSDPKINGVDIRNNLFYQSHNTNCSMDCSFFPEGHIQIGTAAKGVTLNTNSYEPGSPVVAGLRDSNPITGSVRFMNPAALDFHLQPGSAVIDRGITLAAVPTDFDGRHRPQGVAYDIGSFEYVQPEIASFVCDPLVALTPGSSFCTVVLIAEASADDQLKVTAVDQASIVTPPSMVRMGGLAAIRRYPRPVR